MLDSRISLTRALTLLFLTIFNGSLSQNQYEKRYDPSNQYSHLERRPIFTQTRSNLFNSRSSSSELNDGEAANTNNPITNFSLKLLKNIPTNSDENLIISPISAQFLLSLLEKGAGGETQRQLRNGLGSKTGEELGAILHQNENDLKTALGIFYHYQVEIAQSYKDKTKGLLSTITGLDFQGSASESRDKINNWASGVTNSKIQNLIPENYNLQSVSIVLVSAIYFHNTWKFKFNPIGKQEFYDSRGKRDLVPFMEITQNIPLHEVNFNGVPCTVISLPYQNEKYSMVIIAPKENTSLETLVSKMDDRQFNEVIATAHTKYPRFAKLQMPKFKLKTQKSLVEPLQKMKVSNIFGSQSDLSGITTSANLYVSDLLQQASLDVDENGTVAAAATSALLIPLSAGPRPEPRTYTINKPFIAVIVDVINQTPLFISKVNQPRA